MKIYKKCTNICIKCLSECEASLTFSLQESKKDNQLDCINLLLDCIDICSITIRYLLYNSRFIRDICYKCAIICNNCAKVCAKSSNKHYQSCVEICHKCAKKCKKIASFSLNQLA
ncbi:hypothetical protein Halha_1397 [Halobacteroides halobius DSM 5150]|uniref:Ferredoxin n=1 Tax=Halobacteroides halobius (strain ATCC 35273 / DSM 5150 / MD-1) TaxID=748449 RepID=L0K7V6_HALHC|nr:hypothetical protein Halha_1397 [Halobacteroides halobius DSM 5150]